MNQPLTYEEYQRTMTPSPQEIHAFRMEQVSAGTFIRWWNKAVIDERHMEVAFVVRCHEKSVDLFRPQVSRHEYHVPHKNDPRLRLNIEQREVGCWDFAQEDIDYRGELEALKQRVSALEGKKTSVIMDAARKKDAASQYRQLREEAIEMGVEVKGNPSTAWLEEQMEKKIAEQKSPDEAGE